jgi:hypothetical protein
MENRLATLARLHGIRQKRDDGGIGKTVVTPVRRADEGTLSRLLASAIFLRRKMALRLVPSVYIERRNALKNYLQGRNHMSLSV